jgi:Trk K+ transport system NAD-binding subunit
VKVVIAGAGNVGSFIAEDLHKAGHDVLAIEQDANLVAKLKEHIPVRWFTSLIDR